MLSRSQTVLLRRALNTERSVLDATAGRIMRAHISHGEKDHAVEEYINDAASHVAAASASIDQLIDSLDTWLRGRE